MTPAAAGSERAGRGFNPGDVPENKRPRGGGTPGGRPHLLARCSIQNVQPLNRPGNAASPLNPDAAFDAAARAELLERYPGLWKRTDEDLIGIIGDPFTRLMSDADELVAACAIILERRLAGVGGV